MNTNIIKVIVWFVLLSVPVFAFAESKAYVTTILNHTFSPAELTVPANTKVKLIIENNDSTPAEFESYDLNREKVVAGNAKITVFIGPLKPGRYKYFDCFNRESKGTIVVQ